MTHEFSNYSYWMRHCQDRQDFAGVKYFYRLARKSDNHKAKVLLEEMGLTDVIIMTYPNPSRERLVDHA